MFIVWNENINTVIYVFCHEFGFVKDLRSLFLVTFASIQLEYQPYILEYRIFIMFHSREKHFLWKFRDFLKKSKNLLVYTKKTGMTFLFYAGEEFFSLAGSWFSAEYFVFCLPLSVEVQRLTFLNFVLLIFPHLSSLSSRVSKLYFILGNSVRKQCIKCIFLLYVPLI